MSEILVIDDEAGVRSSLGAILEDERYRVHAAADAVEGLALLERVPVDLVFLDVLLPRMGGLEALERLRTARPDLEVIVVSGHANVDMAVRAVKLGAFDFLEKPLSLEKVLSTARNALAMRTLRQENVGLKRAVWEDGIVGASPAMEKVKALATQAAESDARILVLGENGTGKELVARFVHGRSARASKPFVEVNCAAIPDSLIESELFGHERGAFTDAVSTRKGRFEVASGGTLFLDEIGDMSLSAQSKVLRALQEQRITRVGGEKEIEVDVRVIAATNKDLAAEVKAGRFREDLYFRLAVIPVSLPPLRERAGDIPLLVARFLKQLGAEKVVLSEDALDFLRSQPWPGNVRELKNAVERAAVLRSSDCLDAAALRLLLDRAAEAGVPAPEARPEAGPAKGAFDAGLGPAEDFLGLGFNDAKELFEKRYLECKLMENGYNITRTAEAVGMYASNLHGKIKKHGIRSER